MTKLSIKKIREAVLTNRALSSNITDPQIKTIWNSLTPATQKKYLESVEIKETSQKSEVRSQKSEKLKSEI